MPQRTLVLAKPDAVQRGLIGEIIGRFERKGLKVVGLRLLTVPREMAERHYAVHAGKQRSQGSVAHRPAADHDLVAGAALGLEPAVPAAGAIWRVEPLRDDALQ